LVDEDGCNTLPGEVGELIVESPYVALGLRSMDVALPAALKEAALVGVSAREIRAPKARRCYWRGSAARTAGSQDPEHPRCIWPAWKRSFGRHPLVHDVGVLARQRFNKCGAEGGVTLVAM